MRLIETFFPQKIFIKQYSQELQQKSKFEKCVGHSLSMLTLNIMIIIFSCPSPTNQIPTHSLPLFCLSPSDSEEKKELDSGQKRIIHCRTEKD